MKMMEARSAYRGTVSVAAILVIGLLAGSCASQPLPDDDNATLCIPHICHCKTYPVPQDEYGVYGNGANCVCPEHGVIPSEVTRDALVLNITFSEPVVLTRDSLPEFRQVIRLNVTGVQYFLPGAFHGFHSVCALNLKGNSERILEAGVFEGLTQLTHLIVVPTERKKIHSLENGSFVWLKKLKKLKLAENSISALNTEYFRDLEALTTLDMSGNEIAELKSETFVHLSELSDLDLTGNVIRLIQRNAFRGLTQLKFLRLGDNELRGMPEPTFQAWSQTSESSNNHISVILHANPLRCGCHLNWTSRWMDNEAKDCVGTCSAPPEFRGHTISAVFGNTGLSKICRSNNSVISVNAAENVELTCPIGDITWQTPDGHILKESGDMNDSYLLTSKGSLIIMNSSPDHSGQYTCLSMESDDAEGFSYEVSVSQVNDGFPSVIKFSMIAATVGVVVGIIGSVLVINLKWKIRQYPYGTLPRGIPVPDVGRNEGQHSAPYQGGAGTADEAHGRNTSEAGISFSNIYFKPDESLEKSYEKNIINSQFE